MVKGSKSTKGAKQLNVNSGTKLVKKKQKSSESESEDPFFIKFPSDVSDSGPDSELNTVDCKYDSRVKVKVKSERNVKVLNKKDTNVKTIKATKTVKAIKSDKVSKPLTNKRKIIHLNDDPVQPATAAGVIIYKIVDKKMQILLINNRNKFEDIGGKIDDIDPSIEAAAAREVDEETNGVITREAIMSRLTESVKTVYVKNSKYVIYILVATPDEEKLCKDDFGEYENHDKIKRDIQWVSRETAFSVLFIRGKKLNFRLMSSSLNTQLKSIESNQKYKKSMF
jgi:8-oxo-dGTP pyrophosphatase MutT (NUDIX family)